MRSPRRSWAFWPQPAGTDSGGTGVMNPWKVTTKRAGRWVWSTRGPFWRLAFQVTRVRARTPLFGARGAVGAGARPAGVGGSLARGNTPPRWGGPRFRWPGRTAGPRPAAQPVGRPG